LNQRGPGVVQPGNGFRKDVGPVLLAEVVGLGFRKARLHQGRHDLIPDFLPLFPFGQVQIADQFGHTLQAHRFLVVVIPLDDALLMPGVVFHSHEQSPRPAKAGCHNNRDMFA
jgi:hypothetical protein